MMTYVDGFVLAVPTANKEKFREHAQGAVPLFKGLGAGRLVENWGDDVAHGQRTDFYRATQAKDDETVLFSWIEYPSKEARESANQKMSSDPAATEDMKEMPFDGMRMIWSGFTTFLDERNGAAGKCGYVDGFLLPVPPGNEDAYRDMARAAAPVFLENGALRVVEALGDDIMEGKVTDYRKALESQGGESIVFSWVEWPDKATRDAGMKAVAEDERMKNGPKDMPFDGPRAIFGGFETIVDG